MSVEQVVEPQWIYTCDYCKKNEQTSGSMPEYWGRITFSGSNSLGDRIEISHRDFCASCMEKALFSLKFLKGKEQDMWVRK